MRTRVYRHGVHCPDCASSRMRTDGFSGGKQTYSCGDCGRRYLPEGASIVVRGRLTLLATSGLAGGMKRREELLRLPGRQCNDYLGAFTAEHDGVSA